VINKHAKNIDGVVYVPVHHLIPLLLDLIK
jgi:hypothetical protein